VIAIIFEQSVRGRRFSRGWYLLNKISSSCLTYFHANFRAFQQSDCSAI
jgi:hypothetical protein